MTECRHCIVGSDEAGAGMAGLFLDTEGRRDGGTEDRDADVAVRVRVSLCVCGVWLFKERVGSLCGSRVRVGGEGGRSEPKGLKWDTNELRVNAILCCDVLFRGHFCEGGQGGGQCVGMDCWSWSRARQRKTVTMSRLDLSRRLVRATCQGQVVDLHPLSRHKHPLQTPTAPSSFPTNRAI